MAFWLKTSCLSSMFGKRVRPWQEDSGPPRQRLRSNLADLFLGNDISSVRAQSLFQDGQASGAAGLSDVAATQGGRLGKNLCRDLKRKLLKGSAWPQPYVVQARTWNAKRNQEELHDVPVLLPHEVVFAMTEDRSNSEPENQTAAHQHVVTREGVSPAEEILL